MILQGKVKVNNNIMDTKYKVGQFFMRGFVYPTKWEVVNIKLIFDIIHYELKDVRSPKSVVLSEWALIKDDSWNIYIDKEKKKD